jgi:6-phosphofructokinase 1
MAAPHLIYLPEVPFSIEQFVSDVKAKLEEYNSIIVVVSEGIKDEEGNYISSKSASTDTFGHARLSGAAAFLKNVVENEIGCKVRALEPSVIQRSAGHVSALTDVEEAFNLGTVAVKAMLDGKSGVFSTLRRISNKPYSVEYSVENVGVVANNEKTVPRSWINEAGNDVTQDMIDYLVPLVEGVVQTPYRNGLPDYIDIRHLDIKKQKYKE